MQNETLRLVTYKEDPSEQVIWNQERPIAYLNRGDASIDEFIELENLIQAAPKMLKALEACMKEMWRVFEEEGIRADIDAYEQTEEAIRLFKEK